MFATYDKLIGYPTVLTGRKIVHLLLLNLRMYDITPEQWTILRFLGERDGVNQKELSSVSGKDQPTVTRILDIMDDKGWLERRPNHTDRRSFLICLTDEGKTLWRNLEPVVGDVFTKILDGITEEDLQKFKQVLNQMNDNIAHEFENQRVK